MKDVDASKDIIPDFAFDKKESDSMADCNVCGFAIIDDFHIKNCLEYQ